MARNWQQPGWPEFAYDPGALQPLEQDFVRHSGEFLGAFRHVGQGDRDMLRIELISDEALKTSEIEGEVLDRDSVQSSLRRQFGLGTENRQVRPAERGIAKMMVDLYKSFAAPLTHQTMLAWHTMLMSGNRSLHDIGRYRTHADPMQIVSARVHDPEVHSKRRHRRK